MDIPQQPQQEQGEFNQALAYLYRLDAILKHLDSASINEDYEAKYRILWVFYKELYPMMNKKDREKHQEMAWIVREKFKTYKEAKRKGLTTVAFDSVDILDMWDLDLRDLMNDKGMLMPKKSDPRFALASRGGK